MSIFTKLFKWVPFGRVAEMNAENVYEQLKKNELQIVDVRSVAEWEQSHIEDSINLPITQFSSANISKLKLSPETKIVAICLSAHRSIPAVRQLKALGYKDTYQLKGGMTSWWRLKLPTIKGNNKT